MTRIDSRREEDHFMPANASEWQKKHPYEPSAHSHPQPVPLVSPSDLINPMLRASDVAEKGVPVCDPKLPLLEAVAMLSQAESGLLPVVDGGKPVGVLTEREVVAALGKPTEEFFRLTVEAVMSRHFSRLRGDATLDALFDDFGTRGTLVVDKHDKLLGIIYWRNLAGKLSERALGRVLSGLLARENAARAAS
jgi:CBS domain-containing protein